MCSGVFVACPLSSTSRLLLADCAAEYGKLVSSCLADRRPDMGVLDSINMKAQASGQNLKHDDYKTLWEDIATNLHPIMSPSLSSTLVGRGLNAARQCKCFRKSKNGKPGKALQSLKKLQWPGIFSSEMVRGHLDPKEQALTMTVSRRGPKFPSKDSMARFVLLQAHQAATQSFLQEL